MMTLVECSDEDHPVVIEAPGQGHRPVGCFLPKQGGWDTVAAVSAPSGPGFEMGGYTLVDEDNPGPVSPAPPQRRGPSLGFLGLAATCAVPLLYFAYVWHYGVNSFFWDEWTRLPLLNATSHGNLTLSALWLQYNENRLLAPNLIWVLSEVLAHADTKAIMLFDACLFTASYAFLLTIYRRTVGTWLDPLQTVVVGLVWFSVADWENALWAFQVAWYLVVFFLMAMLLALSRREITPVALAMAMVFAAAASFSSLQGLFAWPVGLLCILWRLDGRARKISYAVPWVTVGAVIAGIYFWHFDFHGLAGGGGFGFAFRHPGQAAEYLLAAIGNVFPTGGATSVALHALLGIPLLLAAGWVLGASLRDRIGAPGPHALPLPAALIVFALFFDTSLGVGRVSLGLDGALGSRYTMANLLVLLGVILFAFQRLPEWPRASGLSPSPFRVAVAAILTIVLVAQIASSTNYGLENAQTTRRERDLGASIAINLSAIPVAARHRLVSTYLYPPLYPQLLSYFTLAHQDELGAFAPGSYQRYRALGPPRKAVHKALAAFSRSLAAWCQLAPGNSSARASALMGPPGGTQFALWAAAHPERLPTSLPSTEWDVGDDILVATFENSRVTSLDAFSATLPNPATDTPCPAMRG